MTRTSYPSLITSAETLTQAEMFQAPELPALIALDANLLAVITLLEFQTPHLGHQRTTRFPSAAQAEVHIADSICILANALRMNLSAYYEVFRDDVAENNEPQEILF